MMIREQIEEKLGQRSTLCFEVVDESYRHNVPAGSESHFKSGSGQRSLHGRTF